MVHHIVLYKLKPGLKDETLEEMMRTTRIQLLKIQEVYNIRCGKRLEPGNEWPFFIAVDFETRDKMAIFKDDPIQVKWMEETIKPNTEEAMVLDYELDPNRDVKYS